MKKKKIILLSIATLIFTLTLCGCNGGTTEKSQIIDANKYSGITSEELVKEMGEPEKIDEWNNTKSDGTKYPVKTYIYNSNKYEFLVADNKVIRLSVYSDKYMTGEGEDFNLNSKEDIFPMLGIEPSDNLTNVVDNNVALRYQMVSDKIADVWLPEVKDKSFSMVKITYDLRYFE